jgi:nucleoside-diphosphate-sugar epimerase
MHLQADTAKLSKTTGWEPLVNLDEGLLLTVNAIRERLNDPRD